MFGGDMKKQMMRLFALVLGFNSFSILANQDNKIGIAALAGLAGAVGGTLVTLVVTRNNRKNDERRIETEAECAENRKQWANQNIETFSDRYACELDMNKKGKLSRALLERYALENCGGSNLTPTSSYYERMARDYNSLLNISIEDLSADNVTKYLSLKQDLCTIKKFASAELHEKIQRERETENISMHAAQIRKKELEAREKEITLIREALAMVKSAESSIEQVDQRSARFEASVERNELAIRAMEREQRIPLELLYGIIKQNEALASRMEKVENQNAAQARQTMQVKTAVADLFSFIIEIQKKRDPENPYAGFVVQPSAPQFDS